MSKYTSTHISASRPRSYPRRLHEHARGFWFNLNDAKDCRPPPLAHQDRQRGLSSPQPHKMSQRVHAGAIDTPPDLQ